MHKTSAPTVTVFYPFHPLAGQTLRCVRTRSEPAPAVHLVQLGERRLLIPVWMTSSDARDLVLVAEPHVAVAALRDIAAIVAAFPDASATGARVALDDGSHEATSAAAIRGRAGSPTASADPHIPRTPGGDRRLLLQVLVAPAEGEGQQAEEQHDN